MREIHRPEDRVCAFAWKICFDAIENWIVSENLENPFWAGKLVNSARLFENEFYRWTENKSKQQQQQKKRKSYATEKDAGTWFNAKSSIYPGYL